MSTSYYKARVPFLFGDDETTFWFDVTFAHHPPDSRDTPPSNEEIEVLDFDVPDALEKAVVSSIVKYLFDNRDDAEYLGQQEDVQCVNLQ